MEAKGLDIVLDINTQLPLKIIGDPVRLRQVVLNLVNNSAKVLIGCCQIISILMYSNSLLKKDTFWSLLLGSLCLSLGPSGSFLFL